MKVKIFRRTIILQTIVVDNIMSIDHAVKMNQDGVYNDKWDDSHAQATQHYEYSICPPESDVEQLLFKQ